ncbi:hypothetical protein J6590_016996 [Homalodisca vitripennis]|nr:hypothetical protein J6590_016996 [Homalodisca vitripennis]
MEKERSNYDSEKILARSILPYTPCNAAGMVDSDELVACSRDVEIGLLLVHEESVRDPDVLDELGAYRKRLHSCPLAERQPGIRPELPEVEVQSEVLTKG